MSPHREPRHQPVLPAETLRLLNPLPGETWVDCTAGVGGHSHLIAEKLGNTGRLIALDQDPTMLDLARVRLSGLPVTLVHANFDQVAGVLSNLGIVAADGVLADLGFCSDQMEQAARGFSFRDDGPLDMRLDPTQGESAAGLINHLSESALADVFWEFGEERYSRRIARKIVEERQAKPLTTTAELAGLVRSCVPRAGGIDPATRVFQAIRIAVNDELGSLERLLASLPQVVKPGGRAGIISFHSLEDRKAKHTFRNQQLWVPATKKPVEASEEEIARNPRARSAKLRVATRIGYF
jgi:16S rRNA (cytosine1402-N4)-methyltransferase